MLGGILSSGVRSSPPRCRETAGYRVGIPHALPLPTAPLQGGCLCGAVRFELTAPFASAGYCHCTHCQRRTGTGSSANGRVPQEGFRLLQGEQQLRAFQPPVGVPKLFCDDVRLGAVQRRPVRRSGGRGATGDARPRSGHTTAVPAVRRLGRALGAGSRRRPRAPSPLAGALSAARSRSHCSERGSPQRWRQPSSAASSNSRSATRASTSTCPPPSAAGPRRTRYSSPVSLTHAARCSGPSASSRHHSPTSSSRERTRRSSAL